MKTCVKCQIEKDLIDFSNNKAKKDGKCVYCRSCYTIVNREWRQNNPKQDKKIHDKWKKDNIEKVRKNSLKYYHRHKEERNKYSKQYRQKHKDRIRIKNREYTIKKYYSDINFRLTVLLRGRLWKAIARNSKQSSSLTLLGCTIDELKIHLEKQFTKKMTWKNYGKWHIDHIKPCCSFDLTDFEQQKLCFHYTNLQPLWAKDNIRKNGKVI
jgi:hypothetical protein